MKRILAILALVVLMVPMLLIATTGQVGKETSSSPSPKLGHPGGCKAYPPNALTNKLSVPHSCNSYVLPPSREEYGHISGMICLGPPDDPSVWAKSTVPGVYMSDLFQRPSVVMRGGYRGVWLHLIQITDASGTEYTSRTPIPTGGTAPDDFWIAPYFTYYARTSTPPYYQQIGQASVLELTTHDYNSVWMCPSEATIGFAPNYAGLGWVNNKDPTWGQTGGSLSQTYYFDKGEVSAQTKEEKVMLGGGYIPNNTFLIGYGAKVYVNGHIQELYTTKQYVEVIAREPPAPPM